MLVFTGRLLLCRGDGHRFLSDPALISIYHLVVKASGRVKKKREFLSGENPQGNAGLITF